MYQDKGLKVLGFPCNDFGGQEPGTNEEILKFATSRFGATFDLFEKVHAKGPQQHPLYATLTNSVEPKGEVGWNFEKFLVSKQGEIVARFKSRVEPGAEELITAIERELER